MTTHNIASLISLALCLLLLSGCVGRIVGAAVDTTIEVAKVPFKVGAAAVDVATPDKKKQSKSGSKPKKDAESDTQ